MKTWHIEAGTMWRRKKDGKVVEVVTQPDTAWNSRVRLRWPHGTTTKLVVDFVHEFEPVDGLEGTLPKRTSCLVTLYLV